MRRALVAALVALALVLVLAVLGCRAAERSACAPVEYEGQGEPALVLASDLPLQGATRTEALQINDAIRRELRARGYRVGGQGVGFVACDDSASSTGASSPASCSANANELADDERVIGVVGPLDSRCAAIMLPVLNRAPDGAIPLISPSNTDPCLTRGGAGCDATEPDKYYPSGARNYVRVAPNDVFQGAAGAELARDRGIQRIYVLHDSEAYGVGVATSFRQAATALGIDVVGFEGWDPEAQSYVPLFRRIRGSGADAVFLGGLIGENGGQVIRDKVSVLGPNDGVVTLLASDGFAEARTVADTAGKAAGMLVLSPGVPLRALPPEARRYAAGLAASVRSGARPDADAVYGAQAAQIMLAAIARSKGDRPGVTAGLFGTHVSDGLLGTFGFDANGDPARATGPVVGFTVFRVGRGLVVDTIVDPASSTVAAAGRPSRP